MESFQLVDEDGAYRIYFDDDMFINIEVGFNTDDYVGTVITKLSAEKTERFLMGVGQMIIYYAEVAHND